MDIRDATGDDFAPIAAIAAAGDSEADSPYLSFLQASGSLRVAVDAGTILGFGGVVLVGDDTTMVTDLFIAPHARGQGIGGRLLADLLDGATKRMTFSSKHAAALPAYVRAGMTPSWRLLYLRGIVGARENVVAGKAATERGSPPVPPWRSGRPELAAYYESRGGAVSDNAALIERDGTTFVARLQDDRSADAFDALLASLPSGSTVTCCSPEHSPVAHRAVQRGFEVFDNDVFCCSPGVVLTDELHCLDPGLC